MYFSAMQKRDVFCQSANGTFLPDALCEASEKPITKQECYNDMCKGTWKVGEWTEVLNLRIYDVHSYIYLNFCLLIFFFFYSVSLLATKKA